MCKIFLAVVMVGTYFNMFCLPVEVKFFLRRWRWFNRRKYANGFLYQTTRSIWTGFLDFLDFEIKEARVEINRIKQEIKLLDSRDTEESLREKECRERVEELREKISSMPETMLGERARLLYQECIDLCAQSHCLGSWWTDDSQRCVYTFLGFVFVVEIRVCNHSHHFFHEYHPSYEFSVLRKARDFKKGDLRLIGQENNKRRMKNKPSLYCNGEDFDKLLLLISPIKKDS